MSYRVLVQPRPAGLSEGAGEAVLVLKTIEALRRAGVQADLSTDAAADLGAYDLVQLFGLWSAADSLPYAVNAREQQKPIALTSIYWNPARYRREKRRMLAEWVPNYTPVPDGEPESRVEAAAARAESLAARALASAANLVLPASRAEGEQLVLDFQVAPERLCLAYSGVDPSFAAASPEPFVRAHGISDFVLCAGRIEERKNQFSLLRALQGTGLRVVLAGHAPDPRYLEACRRAGGDQLTVLDRLSGDEMPSLYAAARVHALVSWMECASLANLEAGLAGCNLVADGESSAREYYGDHARYCDPANYASIREAVLAACAAPRSPVLREHILANFTWDHVAQQYAAGYAAMASLPPAVEDGALVQTLAELSAAQRELAEAWEERAGDLWKLHLAKDRRGWKARLGKRLRRS